MPQFYYSMANGEKKSYIDPGVYTSNRQFRLLLCIKLSDRSRTALCLSQPPTLTMFVRSFITHIGSNAGFVPQEVIPGVFAGKPPAKRKNVPSKSNTTSRMLALPTSDPLVNLLHQLLRKQGQPNGTLTPVCESQSEVKFRWNVPSGQPRPCLTARIWPGRPSQAEHKSNGAWVSVNHHGEVYLICLHPQCLHRGHSNRRLLGHVPLSLLHLHSETEEATYPISSRTRVTRSKVQNTKTMYTQQQSKYNEERTGSPDLEVLDELEPQVSLNPNVKPGQLQTIETGQREANSFRVPCGWL